MVRDGQNSTTRIMLDRLNAGIVSIYSQMDVLIARHAIIKKTEENWKDFKS